MDNDQTPPLSDPHSVKPRHKLVLVEVEPLDKVTAGGIVLPNNIKHKIPARFARVVAVGPGTYEGNLLAHPVGIVTGDRVLCQVQNALMIQEKGGSQDGRELALVNDLDVLAVIGEAQVEPKKENE